MPRSEAEIKADMEALKAQGVHPAKASMRALRDELKALHAPVAAVPPAADAEPLTTTSVATSAGVVPCIAEMGPVSRWQSEESFIDAALAAAATNMELHGGSTTGVVKKIYERLDAMVKTRRLIMEVVNEVGAGEPWPQFSVLNRDPNTGRQKLSATYAPVEGQQLPKQESAIPTVTEGGMPIQSRPSPAAVLANMGGGAAVNPAAAIRAQVAAQLAMRPEPVRSSNAATG